MRRAILEVTTECLRDGGLGPIFDHGLEAVYSIQSDPGERKVALVLEGDALPEACELRGIGALQVVAITIRQEAYGRQRLIKVVDIELTGRTGLDVAARALRAA